VRARLAAEPPHSPALEVARGWIAGAPGRRVVLVTGHRRENFGEPFREFCLGLRDIADAHPDVLLVYPVHLNPNVRGPVNELLGDHPRVSLQPPAGYAEFIALMDLATLVITDSGGVQEEAPALGRPVLVTRTVTERPEAVEAGGVLLVGPSRHRLGAAAHRLLTDPAAHAAMAVPRFPYGDGTAAARCLAAIRDFFAA
jgi:UDP-N-acetylglucosamine 2-epimerase (hydrolysing)